MWKSSTSARFSISPFGSLFIRRVVSRSELGLSYYIIAGLHELALQSLPTLYRVYTRLMSKADDDLKWGRSKIDTVCPLDCPDTCSLEVTVENGKILSIDGSDKNPITDGYICGKVRRFGERVYGDARIHQPLIRTGPRSSGQWKTATWDEALSSIASRMTEIRQQWGGESILPFSYGGSNGLLSQDTVDARLFRQFGAARLARTVCAIPTRTASQALYGQMPGVTYADYCNAKLIVIWGANPSSSSIHLLPYIR